MSPSDIAYTPILPEGWSRPRGFSHGVVAQGTRSVRIAGQIGREPGQAHIPEGTDAGTQWRVALGNLVAVLKAAGGEPRHLVALRAYVTDIAEFNGAGAAIGACGWCSWKRPGGCSRDLRRNFRHGPRATRAASFAS